MRVRTNLLIAVALGVALSGCAKINGVVTSNGDGTYQSVSVGGNKPQALKGASNDAKVWCKREHGAKNFVVLKQDVVQNEAPDIDTGNKLGNALVQVAKYADSVSRDDDFEATTRFRCSG